MAARAACVVETLVGVPVKRPQSHLADVSSARGAQTRQGPELPSRNQYDKVKPEDDGSIVLWFGPKKPQGVDEKNFIQSIPGRAQIVAVRLYGTGPEFYDQTWKPDDVVKVK